MHMPALISEGLEPRETGAHPQNEDHHPSRVELPKLIGIAQVRPPPVPKCNRSQSPPRRWRKCNMTRLGSPPLNCDASHAASCLTRKRGLNERRSLTCQSSPSQRGQLPANQTARNELDARTGREQCQRRACEKPPIIRACLEDQADSTSVS